MASSAIKLKRRELYRQVWTLSVKVVAHELGVSANAVSDACKRLGVPIPSTHYWNAIRLGRRVAKAKLPPWPKNIPDWTVVVPRNPPVSRLRVDADVRRELRRLLKAAADIDWHESGNAKHPLIKEWSALAKNEKFAPRFSKAHHSRSPIGNDPIHRRILHILNCLLIALEKCGFEIEGQFGRITVRYRALGSEPIHFRAYERGKTSLRSLKGPVHPTGRRFSETLKPTGVVAISILSYVGPRMKRRWQDMPGRPLEDRLPELLASLMKLAAYMMQKKRARIRASGVLGAKLNLETTPQRRRAELARLIKSLMKLRRVEASPKLVRAVDNALQSTELSEKDRLILSTWRAARGAAEATQ